MDDLSHPAIRGGEHVSIGSSESETISATVRILCVIHYTGCFLNIQSRKYVSVDAEYSLQFLQKLLIFGPDPKAVKFLC